MGNTYLIIFACVLVFVILYVGSAFIVFDFDNPRYHAGSISNEVLDDMDIPIDIINRITEYRFYSYDMGSFLRTMADGIGYQIYFTAEPMYRPLVLLVRKCKSDPLAYETEVQIEDGVIVSPQCSHDNGVRNIIY